LKLIHLPLVLLVSAVFCVAQTATGSGISNADESVDQAAAGTSQTPDQTQPPAPTAGQPAQPSGQPQDGQPQNGQSQNGQPQNDQTQKDKSNQPPSGSGTSSNTTSGTSKDRLFFALPNFLTLENAGQVPPLTSGEKFKVVAKGSFDPIQIVWYGALSAICQAENCESGYGQGWAAYAKRYGAYAADGTIENFFVGAIFPSMLHQDPRYFQNGHGSFFHRTGYAVSRIFVTRTDSGGNQFNYSEIIGAAVSSAISTYSYHPHPPYQPGSRFIGSDRTFKNTASVWGSQVGYDTLTLVIKEFWPDIRRKIRKRPQQ
jgi:hypothetical protein